MIRLQPDPPAAAFLDLVLFDQGFLRGRDALTEWMFIALRENAATFGNRLARVLYDLHVLGRVDEGLHPLDERLVEMLLERADRAATFANVARGEVSFWATNFAAHVALIMAGTAEPEAKAGYLNNAGAYLTALGRREEALAAAREAADLYRALAAARPEALTSDLAMSQNNLAATLLALGRRDEALAAAREAADLYRALAAAWSEAFTPDLTMSLNHLAIMLAELGQWADVLAVEQEAAALLPRK